MLWLYIAVAAGALELLLPYFTFIFVVIAALLTFFVSFGFGTETQLLVFSFTVVASLAFFRPWIKMAKVPLLPSRADLRVGQRGVVTAAVEKSGHVGRVLVNDEDWAARAEGSIAVDRIIKVVGTDGIILIVEEIEWNL